jgi:hypothetical protein
MTDPRDLLMTPGPGQAALEKVQENERMQDQEQPNVEGGANTLVQPENVDIPSGATLGDMARVKGALQLSPRLKDFSKGMDGFVKQNPKAATQPGGWARAAVAGVQSLIGGVEAGLGDAAAVGTVPSGGGALTGVTRTLAARSERLSNEQTQAFLRAESQARTVATMRNIYRQDRQDRLASYGQTKSMIDAMRENHDVQDGITQTQLNEMLKKNPDLWHTHTGGAIGERAVLDANGKQLTDPKGNPVYEPVYALAEIRAKDGAEGSHEVTPTEADYFKRNTGTALPPGTKLTTDQYVYLYKKAHGVEDVTSAIQKANDGELSAENLRQVQTELQDPAIQHYVAMVPSNPLAGLNQAKKNAADHINAVDQQIAALQQKPGNDAAIQQLQQKRQQFVDEDRKITHVVTFGFNDTAKENYARQAETERHDRAEEANKAEELRLKKVENNFINPPGSAGLTGEAYLKTLPQPQRELLKAINEGREVRSPRQLQDKNGNPTPLALALHQAYPDFDITKTENFAKVRKDFSNPNGTGGQITAFGTVLNHMRRLYDNATTEALIPGTEAHRKLEVDTHNVAVEMANALTTHGKAAEAEIKDQEKALNAWTPSGRRQKIQEAVKLLDGKLSEREQQWKNAAPSPTYAPPMPGISDEARANADYVLSGGQTQQAQPGTVKQNPFRQPQVNQ